MTASIVGFVTRAEAGLRAPRSVSRNVDPDKGGVAVHYGGDGGPPPEHAGCVVRWRAWQNFHMDGRGWVDIAYNFGYCNHGYVFAGRGFGVRSAAQGTNDGNQRYLAAVWIGGGSSTPTQLAVNALEWIITQVRKNGGGNDVRPHRSFKSTSCPGDYLASVASRLSGVSISTPSTPPASKPPASKPPASKPPASTGSKAPNFPLARGYYFGPKSGPVRSVSGYYSHREDLKRWQTRMRERGWLNSRGSLLVADGLFGDETERVVRLFQKQKRLAVDGKIGPSTWAAAWTAPVT